VLQLRVYGSPQRMSTVAAQLGSLPGIRHVDLLAPAAAGDAVVSADLRADAADSALEALRALGITGDDVALVRLEVITPGASSDGAALVWAEIVGQARTRARTHMRYIVLMAAAGVIAGLAVLNNSATLVVGAMAISPDLLPVTAACTGIVLRRARLVYRGLATLLLGLTVAGLLAAAVSFALDRLGLIPHGFSLHEFSAAQTHVSATTIIVAFTAGVAGMLAVETRASATVGVAISVTTIPATAFLGVALGIGEFRTALPAVAVLAVNISLMLLGGSIVLALQRWQRSKA
jgi:uncharacterized hydrophobic protein (TIGR00271 family)